jgi:probable rRNA maturation factor
MKTTKTYKAHNLTIEFSFDSKSLSRSQLKKIQKGMKYFIQACQIELSHFPKIKMFVIDLSLIGDARMKTVNAKFRNKNKTTDVLSFPMEEDARKLKNNSLLHLFLGDILISKPVTLKQAKQFKITFEREFFHLLVHGFLHLLGHDHERSLDEEKRMFALEEKILKKMVVQFPNL